jgi:putative transposase
MTETMRIQQGYKDRIYPAKAQEIKLRQVLETKRFVYNHFLAKRKQHYEETGKGLSYGDCANELPALLAAGTKAAQTLPKTALHASKKAQNRVNEQGAKWRKPMKKSAVCSNSSRASIQVQNYAQFELCSS